MLAIEFVRRQRKMSQQDCHRRRASPPTSFRLSNKGAAFRTTTKRDALRVRSASIHRNYLNQSRSWKRVVAEIDRRTPLDQLPEVLRVDEAATWLDCSTGALVRANQSRPAGARENWPVDPGPAIGTRAIHEDVKEEHMDTTTHDREANTTLDPHRPVLTASRKRFWTSRTGWAATTRSRTARRRSPTRSERSLAGIRWRSFRNITRRERHRDDRTARAHRETQRRLRADRNARAQLRLSLVEPLCAVRACGLRDVCAAARAAAVRLHDRAEPVGLCDDRSGGSHRV